MTKIFVSQFLQEQWGYDYAYVHLVPDLVAWLLEKKALVRALPGDVLAVTFRSPMGCHPLLVEDCDDANLTAGFMAGNDTLMVPAEDFPFPDGVFPNWTRLQVTKTGVSWAVDTDGDWLETHELPWEEVSHD